MDSETDQWSKLPSDLVIMVAKRLDTSTDILRLRAVCSSWRSSLPRSPKNNSPLFSFKIPSPNAPNPALNRKSRGHLTFYERTIYYLEPSSFENPNDSASSQGWMVSVEESKPGKILLLDPLSNCKFQNLRETSSKVLNLLNFRVSEVSKVCNLKFVDLRNDETNFNELKSASCKKVVMSSIPAGKDDGAVNFALLTMFAAGKLGYFNLGDKKWSAIDDGQERSHYYEDIVFHNGKFYAVAYTGRLLEIDLMVNVRVIESAVPCYGMLCGGQYKYLVESLGDLYLLDKYSDVRTNFVVYKFNDEQQEWVQVTSLGDRSFFIGDDCCFSVSARQFSGCKRNCIYFSDLYFTDDNKHPGYGVGMFDLENRSVGPLSFFERYSQIFWPPPTWLMPKASSKPSPNASLKSSSSRR